MDSNDDLRNRQRWTGLWMRTAQRSGNDYWISAPLRESDIELLVEFARQPAKLMIFRNLYKERKTHPDATIFLYRAVTAEQWEEHKRAKEQGEKPPLIISPGERGETPF